MLLRAAQLDVAQIPRHGGRRVLLRAGHGVRVELQSLDGQLTDAADAGSRVDLERLGQAGVTDVDQVRVIADIHLHTGSGVRQSHTDAAHPMVARAGHLALIAPQFGRGVTRVDQLGAHLKGAQLAVAAAFFQFVGQEEDNLCQDTLRFDLWSPDQPEDRVPPQLRYAPAQCWLLGLGHLGQAYAHAISWLHYTTPAEVDVALQDVQRTVPANHSTGLFTPRGSDGRHKTRLVADALERCGLNTSNVERLMDESTTVRASDMHVALVGVDNLPTRRNIDNFGWRTAIDVPARPPVQQLVRRRPYRPGSAYSSSPD
jgi:hypothetical protein